MNCSYGSSLSLSPQSFVPRRCLYSRPAAGFLCQQSTKEIVCDDYEEEWKKSYEKTIEVTSEAEIFVQRSPIMMMRTPAVEETAGLVAEAATAVVLMRPPMTVF